MTQNVNRGIVVARWTELSSSSWSRSATCGRIRTNPRRGDVEAIQASLERDGQYRALVVNRRTNEVLAGNHTLAAAKRLGLRELAVTYVDVDADQARRIVLADNRTSDVAGYDEAALAKLLQGLPDLAGTGYDSAALGV
jgi:hypothetical protein